MSYLRQQTDGTNMRIRKYEQVVCYKQQSNTLGLFTYFKYSVLYLCAAAVPGFATRSIKHFFLLRSLSVGSYFCGLFVFFSSSPSMTTSTPDVRADSGSKINTSSVCVGFASTLLGLPSRFGDSPL